MADKAKHKYEHLRHVRGDRQDLRWTVFHIRANTIDQQPWLAREDCAAIFVEELFRLRKKYAFGLFAFVIMPEHVHLVLMPTEVAGISKIMMSLKRCSAWKINQRLGRKGRLWRKEFFDHWARKPKQIAEAIQYLHSNPVRRGLVRNPEDYPYSSCLAWKSPEKSPYKIDRDCFW